MSNLHFAEFDWSGILFLLVWGVIGLFSFLAKVVKSASENKSRGGSNPNTTPVDDFTYEDMLAEKAKQALEQTRPQEKKKPRKLKPAKKKLKPANKKVKRNVDVPLASQGSGVPLGNQLSNLDELLQKQEEMASESAAFAESEKDAYEFKQDESTVNKKYGSLKSMIRDQHYARRAFLLREVLDKPRAFEI